MSSKEVLDYYSRKDVQKAICHSSKEREAVARFGEAFGKRPDVIQMPGDVFDLAKKGATSFHISEERWKDPLSLQTGLSKKQLDELRHGWDLIIDIDTKLWDFSKYTAYLIYEALKFNNVKNISVKFSGNKGWHLGIPFEAFPDEVHGMETKKLFPDSLKVIAAFIKEKIGPELSKQMLLKSNIEDIAQNAGIDKQRLIKNGKFDPFGAIEIDTILISSRHLFRAPYSLHEKSGLVSLPINPKEILSFDKEMANPKNIKADKIFLERESVNKNEGKELIIQAFDWHFEKQKKNNQNEPAKTNTERTFENVTDLIKADSFPPCMVNILKGNMADGKKRALFVLINFLKQMNWPYELIEKTVKEWNNKNQEPLRENYVMAQLLSAKRQGKMMPPNCSNESYFIETGLCTPNSFCHKIKNPANYSLLKHKISKRL